MTQRCANPTFCESLATEFIGNSNYRSQVRYNTICDTAVGINVIGGNIDIHHNVIVKAPGSPTVSDQQFGLSVDGHAPYSNSAYFHENYVSGYRTGFLADGSVYVVFDHCDVFASSGLHPDDLDFQSQLNLQQLWFDEATRHIQSINPWTGWIDRPAIRDNRFFRYQTRGLSLYRANWAFIGYNVVDSEGYGDDVPAVVVDGTTNSWFYGNVLRNSGHGIRLSGGACFNGLGHWCGAPGCAVGGQAPNTYAGNRTNVEFVEGYCTVPGSLAPRIYVSDP